MAYRKGLGFSQSYQRPQAGYGGGQRQSRQYPPNVDPSYDDGDEGDETGDDWEPDGGDGAIAEAYQKNERYRKRTLDDLYQRGLSGDEGDEPPPDYVFDPDSPEGRETADAFMRGVRARKRERERYRSPPREPKY